MIPVGIAIGLKYNQIYFYGKNQAKKQDNLTEEQHKQNAEQMRGRWGYTQRYQPKNPNSMKHKLYNELGDDYKEYHERPSDRHVTYKNTTLRQLYEKDLDYEC